MFEKEIARALQAYEQHIVCLDKTPDECAATLRSLVQKAVAAFENRAPHLRHGIALDKHITVILSQNDGGAPLCGIYFNLHTPYSKAASKAAKAPGHASG